MRFNGKKILITIISVVVAVSLIIGSSLFYSKAKEIPVVQRFVSDVGAFFGRGVSAPTSALGKSTNSLTQLFKTYKENQRLVKRVDQIAADQVKIQTLKKENKELKANLKLKDSLTDYSTSSAVVVSRTPSSWNGQLIINKGSNAGVKKNSPILDSKGLIGKVTQVSDTSSKVTLISNVDSDSDRFPVQVTSGGKVVNGIISGYDSDTDELVLDELTSKSTVKKGSLVQTSGLGGILPKGLYVGKVVSVRDDTYGIAKEIYIKPAANLSDISSVLVVTGVGGNE
ncbi:rod shape-determining protein MreC [Oenococcus oeni]|uniref:rod shape-determining protein MreC n=1 Tax=Oenococcus oeni TaxID=1247 RepID=UPI0002979BF4|nr:rod shape-determining protein MreC [Oenococcus oeni]EKP88490.1 rod shape-determining protein MreC [Oenococcus oeni DSM 20252 = AWRIB129]KGH52661.1 rod shape-determining protein MreC [Oenococcus oeni IOEB_S277]KGH57683.1 rod shape-determining protein MreC [Oenococcus oeni IOEB_B10]KGH84130.1 rod shape-determining protein MreC [Oenococcus oeni S15]KGH92225.1 rod shape-determining protein MreC [Oenococcus oeni S161]